MKVSISEFLPILAECEKCRTLKPLRSGEYYGSCINCGGEDVFTEVRVLKCTSCESEFKENDPVFRFLNADGDYCLDCIKREEEIINAENI